jgi:hypothetical protein
MYGFALVILVLAVIRKEPIRITIGGMGLQFNWLIATSKTCPCDLIMKMRRTLLQRTRRGFGDFK